MYLTPKLTPKLYSRSKKCQLITKLGYVYLVQIVSMRHPNRLLLLFR